MSDTTAPSGSSMTRYLPLIVIALVAASGWFFFRDYLSFEALRDNREALLAFRDANYLAMVAGYIVAYVAIVAFSLPGATPATLAGGFLFGLFPGAFYVVVSATLGAIVIFLAAKWGLGEALAARMDASSGRIKRIKEGIEANELPMLFLIRLVPAVPFFVANLLPALVGVALGPYVFTTFFGIMPGTVVYTWVGAGLGEVFARGDTPDLGIIFEPMILGPILGLCALALLPIIIKAVRGKEGV
ncbi:TVP38/TMEM64 family protein [Rhodophyticola sp. DY48A3-103]|nr:VTT domain-containing protein [Alterinioella nitratireducens]NPD19578.1 TVP38/TMEM64 family protein [Alterinioella nitratireducens]